MTTEALVQPGEAHGQVVAAGRDGRGLRAEDRPTTTVTVVPLWDRRRTEVRG
ncbi:hypothetical protein ACGFNV_10100 [Streptomyces sp. NPDC048751]|uniref:hypothetical protein n=1 Tax=Streptomyces sp. NPDC048751 TaxID=3365591 RepID=UPI0010F3BEE7